MTDANIKPNAELAYRVLDQIDADPKSWDQSSWYFKTSCGTVACFAGWAVELDSRATVESTVLGGWRWVAVDENRYTDFREAACALLGIEDDLVRGMVVPGTDEGDDEYEGEPAELFDGSNTREDLGVYVEAIFGPRPGGAS